MRAFVDQIDNGKASLLLGDDESIKLVIPVEWLPSEASEGLVLNLTFTVDNEATEKGKARVKSLLDQLGNNP